MSTLQQTQAREVSATTTLPLAMIVAALANAGDSVAFAQVGSPEMAELAGEQVNSLRKLHRALDAKREELKRPFLEGCRGIDDFFREALTKIKDADGAISRGLVAWNQEQKRIADEAAAKARKEAEDRARIQREAAEREQAAAREAAAEAERKRQQIEIEATERQRRLAAEAAAAEPARVSEIVTEMVQLEQQQEADAAKLEREAQEARQREQAAAEQAAAADAQALVVPIAAAPVQSAVGMRDHWVAEVHDFAALVRAVAADSSLLELLQVDQSALNKMAGALKGHMRVPGVRVRNDQRIASKRGRAAA